MSTQQWSPPQSLSKATGYRWAKELQSLQVSGVSWARVVTGLMAGSSSVAQLWGARAEVKLSCNQRALLCWGHACHLANVSWLRLRLSLPHSLPEQSLQSDTCRLPSDYFTALPSSSCTSLPALVSLPSLLLAGGSCLGQKYRKGERYYLLSLFCHPNHSSPFLHCFLWVWGLEKQQPWQGTLFLHLPRTFLCDGCFVWMRHQNPTAPSLEGVRLQNQFSSLHSGPVPYHKLSVNIHLVGITSLGNGEGS